MMFKVPASKSGANLVDVVSEVMDCSGKQAKRILDNRRVFVNGRRIWMAKHRVKRGDNIEIHRGPLEHNTLTKKDILYIDPRYVILDKPPGWLSNGAGSAESALRKLMNDRNLQAVHRLDRDTSGCLLFAVNAESYDRVISLFKERKIDKVYNALVAGKVSDRVLRITSPIGGKPAVSLIRILSSSSSASHVKVKIETGRTHQIRKHLAGIGHPVLGDKQYTTHKPETKISRAVPRQMLHASSLSLTCPVTGQTVHAKAKMPGDFRKCMNILKLS